MYKPEGTNKQTGTTKPSRGQKKAQQKARSPFKGMRKKGMGISKASSR